VSQLAVRPARSHTSEPSAVYKVADSFDLVRRSRVLNKRKQVNAFDIKCLSIRKFDMREELEFQKIFLKKVSRHPQKRAGGKEVYPREPRPFQATLRCHR
jgi:hypothetical protein